jgi:hypothetical protein
MGMGWFGFSGARASAGLSAGLWPRDRIEAAIFKRYGSVQGPHLRDEYVLYGIIEGSVAFVIVLHHPEGRAKDVDQVLFYTRFEGAMIDEATAAAINRNLHLAAARASDGALEIFAGFEPAGPYDERALAAYFDSWKRDLGVAIGVLTGEASYAAAFGLDRDPELARLAVNALGETGRAPRDILRSLFGPNVERRLCGACAGRGRIGFLARRCAECEGAGLVETELRERSAR